MTSFGSRRTSKRLKIDPQTLGFDVYPLVSSIGITLDVGPQEPLRVVHRIGSGTFGVVNKVKDTKGALFANKIVYDEHRELEVSSAIREMSVLSTFQGHPAIVKLFKISADLVKQQYSLVMELMDGDLRQFWEKESEAVRLEHVRWVSYQILSGLATLHAENMVHRDIKSQNIFFTRTKNCLQVKLGDFGLSRRLSGKNYTDTVLTPSYKPPEMLFQTAYKNYGPEIDLWSCGLVLVEFLLGYSMTNFDRGDDLICRLSTIFDFSMYHSPLTEQTHPMGLRDYLEANSSEDTDPLLIDLLIRLLDVNPETRITAIDALHHPYFHLLEPTLFNAKYVPSNAMDWTPRHPALTRRMRTTLIEWLCEITEGEHCNVETFSQSLEILDVFMARTSRIVTRSNFQLVGCGCFFLSCAMNEIFSMDSYTIQQLTDESYTEHEILEMAWEIFLCLDHLMPRTRLTTDMIRDNSLDLLQDLCVKYCTQFPNCSL